MRRFLALSALLAAPAPATAAPWWYVDHDTHAVLFIDAGSIERDKDMVTYTAKIVLHDDTDPVGMTSSFMRADCRNGLLGRLGIQRYGHDDRVIDTSTGAEAMAAPADAVATSALRFVCSGDGARAQRGQFVLAVDDRAFSDALIGGGSAASPRAVQDAMLASPNVTIIRSSAAGPDTFGRPQTVKRGEPIVPPRDYAKWPQIPVTADDNANEVGRIYDITYQGIQQGALQFEVRGYEIDDLAHPGSSQIETVPSSAKRAKIRDIAITIKAATPDSLTYSVAIEKDVAVHP